MPALYLHIPFCIQKCHYCDFATAPFRLSVVPAFLETVEREATLCAPVVSEPVSTVFFGGGTPSLLTGEQFASLMRHLRNCFAIRPDAEITLEANPGTLDPAKLDILRNAGVNRISLGAQVFDDALLSLLGREHSAQDTFENFRNARAAGFANLSLDLIFALPNQSPDDWKRTVETAVSLNPEHLSTYSLTIEPKTVFHLRVRQGKLPLPNEDAQAEMYEWTMDALPAYGYGHYEISNFAREGYACRHNLAYWNDVPYVGLGPGAWSYLNGERYGNIRGTQAYMKRLREGVSPVVERERLTGLAARAEALMVGLRQIRGVRLADYRTRFGATPETDFPKEVAQLTEWGLLETAADCLRLTRRGILLADAVFSRFLTA